MTKLLDKAVARVRNLSDEEQDALALAMLSWAESPTVAGDADEATRAAIGRGLAQVRSGEAVPDSTIDALWSRHGL